jgi:hypothetical protein
MTITPIVPTIGGIVRYRLTVSDSEAITRRRTTGASIAERMRGPEPSWPAGAQAHIGSTVSAGEEYPMLIVRVFDATINSRVNGKVFLDGTDEFWVTSAAQGEGPGTFSWPPRT